MRATVSLPVACADFPSPSRAETWQCLHQSLAPGFVESSQSWVESNLKFQVIYNLSFGMEKMNSNELKIQGPYSISPSKLNGP